MSRGNQKLFKKPFKSDKQVQMYRCNQCCAEFECECHGHHEYDEKICNEKCSLFPNAKCVPVSEVKPIILKSEKPKKVIVVEEEV